MKIEVSSHKSDSTKDKGDLLEALAKNLLEAQGYSVIEEIRVTGAELDLLCTHKVTGKRIYVECKAQKDNISAPILRQLLGTVVLHDYSEGWLISTAEFGKEAKGVVEELRQKPISSRLAFYYPERVIEALIDASVISPHPMIKAIECVGSAELLGDWTLLVTKYGLYWCVYTLEGGAPTGILLYNAKNSSHITDEITISNLSSLDSSLSNYEIRVFSNAKRAMDSDEQKSLPTVIEVQTGDSWDDYRPARPKDFVGRDKVQKQILRFLEQAKTTTDGSRVFAITGNSGLGKSSLIAKLRDRSRNKINKNKYFIYAVDIRGARSPSYILASLLSCLHKAQKSNFGDNIELTVTDPRTPLNSPSIVTYLNSLEQKEQVICLVFDQFEELYSKPELFGIFQAAKDLMLDAAGCKRNFVLGFAWKTDSTTHQDHPAYHLWHELADHRKEFVLDVFDSGEISNSITKFEKEMGHKITSEIRHQVSYSSQGFPWLLKKLCINLYESMNKGEGIDPSLSNLDARRLFEADLSSLSGPESTCLRLIAEKAPADWSEIIEMSGADVLKGLIHKRFVIKSGDRLNIYWDIFKDYLLTGKAPIIPFNYIPSTDASSLLKVFSELKCGEYENAINISASTNLNERTILNIGADLVMFGLAERDQTKFKVSRSLSSNEKSEALNLLRAKINNHTLKIALYKSHLGKQIDQHIVIETLRRCLPNSNFRQNTWNIYGNRLINYLGYAGFISKSGNKILVQDVGTSVNNISATRKGKREGSVFSISVSPASVVDCMISMTDGIKIDKTNRNPLVVLNRFGLVKHINGMVFLNQKELSMCDSNQEALWLAAKKEESLCKCVEIINSEPEIKYYDLADKIAIEYGMAWSESSKKRTGSILMQWSKWIKSNDLSSINNPPGRRYEKNHDKT